MKRFIGMLVSLLIGQLGIAQLLTENNNLSLTSFDVAKMQNGTQLKWKTVCYLTHAVFQVQKSYDGRNFSTIYTMTADRNRCLQPFTYNDSTQPAGKEVYYRVNAGNIDGDLFHSRILKINGNVLSGNKVAMYPNIIRTSANLVLSLTESGTVKLMVHDVGGRMVSNAHLFVQAGTVNTALSLPQLTTGIYRLTVIANNKWVQTIPFTKV